jgi:hypothetical protein
MPHIEFVEDGTKVRVHGSAADEESFGDLGIGHAPGQQSQHLDLPRRQVLESGWGRRPCFCQYRPL